MSKRLQVLLDESEFLELQRVAGRRRMTAGRHAFPTAATVDDMNAEIQRGYLV
jgi:hypothetical protein